MNTKILIVGAGQIGSNVLQMLAKFGFSDIEIVSDLI